MTNLTALIVPLLICGICTYAYFKKVDISSAFKTGVFNGISVIKSIFPPILMILSAVYMLRASGFIELLSGVLTPFFSLVGIPPECSMLMLEIGRAHV